MNHKRKVAEAIREQIDIDLHAIEELIEIPPNTEMGDYAFPCFQLAKIFRKDPNIIAEKLKRTLKQDGFEKVQNLGAYVNFFIDKNEFIKRTLEKILSDGDNYGESNIGEGKTICIEYSSPNIAKPFQLGDLFSTVIGNSLYKLFRREGYKVERLNQLGDWGSKFGKLISAYKRWGNEEALEENAIAELLRVYVKFHEEAQKDPWLEEEGRAYFKELRSKNENIKALWKKFRDLSIREFESIYNIFNISFDSYVGESFYDDKIDSVVDKLKEKRILSESNGMQIVMLNEYNMPPCIILEANYGVKCAVRDLATAIYRKDTYNFHKCIYVVEASETLYFKKIFKVLELLGCQWVKDCIHARFGLVKFQDKSYFSRKGEVDILDDLINRAIEKSLEIINEKNSSLENKEEVAKKIGVGALIFTYLKNSREKDIVFDLNEIISFEGETGPYIQYVYSRANTILKNVEEFDIAPNFGKMNSKEEIKLVKTIESFSNAINDATEKLEPSIITEYTVKVANTFNMFYNSHLVLNLEDKELMKARLILVEATCQVIKNALDLIGIEVVEDI